MNIGHGKVTFSNGTTFDLNDITFQVPPSISNIADLARRVVRSGCSADFEVRCLKAVLRCAHLGAQNLDLNGRAAEAFIFDYVTVRGYRLNLLTGDYQ